MAETLEIPTRKNKKGEQEIETRPVYVEEWLDSLPYADFDKTIELINAAIRATNRVKMKPVLRIELIGQYNRPYQYYIDSQIQLGACHTLRTIEVLQSQAHALKQVSVAMGMACRLVVEETLNQKTLWIQSKPPLPAILSAINYYSHTLIFSFLEYAPVPKNIWREINFLYDFAEGIEQENNIVDTISDSDEKETGTITSAYKRIILASMVDPHHLPFGAIWEIFIQLNNWLDSAEIKAYEDITDGKGYFVMDLKNDVRPVSYSKFNKRLAKGRKLRMLDATALVNLVASLLRQLEAKRSLGEASVLSSHHAKSVLTQIANDWGTPAKRQHPRKSKSGNLELAIGINSSHYFLNGKQNFVSRVSEDDDDVETLLTNTAGEHIPEYSTETWQLVDQCSGGFAITRELKPNSPIRVGDLVAIKTAGNGHYTLGMIRWLMIRPNKTYKTGIQIVCEEADAVSVRTSSSSNLFYRGFLSGDPNSEGAFLITESGLYSPDKDLEINTENKSLKVKVSELKESTSVLEQFGINSH